MSRRAIGAVAGLGLLVLLGGCRKFTRSNFELLRAGVDTHADVRQVLGRPTADLGDQWYYEDSKRHYSASIYFDTSGRVTGKEWMNAKTGEWQGHNPRVDSPPEGEVREIRTKTTRIDDD